MKDGKIEKTDIVIDEQVNWRAVIEDLDNVVTLSFYTKPTGIPIQGEIHDALDKIYNYEDQISAYGVSVLSDDGFCGIYLDDLPKDKWKEVKPKMIEFLTDFYNKNKTEFSLQVIETLKDYDEL